MDDQVFRELGHRLVDALGAYIEELPGNPVYRPLPDKVRRRIEEMELPAEGIAPGEIVEFRQLRGKLALVFARDRDVGAIQISQFCGSQGQRSHCGDRARNPTVRIFLLSHLSGGVGGRPGFAPHNNVAILVRAGLGELVAELFAFLKEI